MPDFGISLSWRAACLAAIGSCLTPDQPSDVKMLNQILSLALEYPPETILAVLTVVRDLNDKCDHRYQPQVDTLSEGYKALVARIYAAPEGVPGTPPKPQKKRNASAGAPTRTFAALVTDPGMEDAYRQALLAQLAGKERLEAFYVIAAAKQLKWISQWPAYPLLVREFEIGFAKDSYRNYKNEKLSTPKLQAAMRDLNALCDDLGRPPTPKNTPKLFFQPIIIR